MSSGSPTEARTYRDLEAVCAWARKHVLREGEDGSGKNKVRLPCLCACLFAARVRILCACVFMCVCTCIFCMCASLFSLCVRVSFFFVCARIFSWYVRLSECVVHIFVGGMRVRDRSVGRGTPKAAEIRHVSHTCHVRIIFQIEKQYE